ncbi:MAG: PIN domain-containing protein [Terracidiphilus sp.]
MKIAADANVLLSAVIGGRARLVLNHPEIKEVLTSEATFAEVREYAVLLGRKKKLTPDSILLTMAALPVKIISTDVCADAIDKARRLIGWRDPDDIEILALALHFKIPLWTNDNDFEGCGIERFTTAEILQKLGIFGAG